jgi:hypothetical protein
MSGIFTYHNFSLQDTPSLEGQVAVVTVRLTRFIDHYMLIIFSRVAKQVLEKVVFRFYETSQSL